MTHDRDAWDETGDSGNGIEGQHLKCAKGTWLLDDEEIQTGDDGVKICAIMDTACVGQVLWAERKIAERDVGRIEDGAVPPKKIHDGWNPYISFMAVRADEGHLGELATFTSSSWGGRFAFQKLVNPYRLKQRKQFPIVTLETKDRNDENRNVDPVFKIVGWSSRDNFGDLLAPEPERIEANETAPRIESAKPKALFTSGKPLVEVFDDDVPF